MSLQQNCSTLDELRAMSHEELAQYAFRLSSGVQTEGGNSVSLSTCDNYDVTNDRHESTGKKRRRAEKPFNMDRFGQRMIALKLCYIGWHFHGFATQPNAKMSVEDHLFAALLQTRLISSRDSCAYSRAGRTDVGVSALGQVVGLRVRSNVVSPSMGSKEFDYVSMINAVLPHQIRILCWAPVSEGCSAIMSRVSEPKQAEDVNTEDRLNLKTHETSDGEENAVRRPGALFSARFDAVHRTYKYFFSKGLLNVAAMRAACAYFVGRHDFRNFCKIDVEKVSNFVRVMYEVDIRRSQDDFPTLHNDEDNEFTSYYVYIRGQAFLWHQVRCMAAVLFEVGKGNEEPEIVKHLLNDATTGTGPFSRGKPSYMMAPAAPLLLYDCAYPPSVLQFFAPHGHDQTIQRLGLFRADATLANIYGIHSAQTAVLQSMLCANDKIPVAGECASLRTGETDSECLPFGMVRGPRCLVPLNGPSGSGRRYVPMRERAQEPSVEEKRERMAVKKRTAVAAVL